MNETEVYSNSACAWEVDENDKKIGVSFDFLQSTRKQYVEYRYGAYGFLTDYGTSELAHGCLVHSANTPPVIQTMCSLAVIIYPCINRVYGLLLNMSWKGIMVPCLRTVRRRAVRPTL